MKLKSLTLLVMGVLSAPIVAQAADSPHSFTGNVALVSDYLFRGVTQTQHKPAIQGGFDYSHASGFYIGTWASNVSWVEELFLLDNSSIELDLYGGYRGSVGDFGYDVGAITYYYPGDDKYNSVSPNTTELYLSGSWKFLTLKYSHVVSKNFIAWQGAAGQDTKGSNYLELNASYDLGNGWGVSGHVGHQAVAHLSDANYTDWKVGVTKDLGFATVGLAYSDTNADTSYYTIDQEKIAKGRLIASISKTF